MTQRIMVSAHLLPEDVDDLDSVEDALLHANRHLVTIAAIRAGVRVLRGDPAKVIDLLRDQRFVGRLRVRLKREESGQ